MSELAVQISIPSCRVHADAAIVIHANEFEKFKQAIFALFTSLVQFVNRGIKSLNDCQYTVSEKCRY